MLLHRPFQTVTPTLDGPVLQVLAGADTRFSVTQVTELVGDASPDGVRKALNRLAEQGVVLRDEAGVTFFYRLNRDHLMAAAIQEIAGARSHLRQRVAEHAQAWTVPPRLLALFGSAARGDMHIDSDLDLVAVADDVDERWLDDLGALCAAMTSWTGNDTRPLVLSAAELTGGPEPVLVELGRDAIVLFGDSGLLRHARTLAARRGGVA